MRVPSKALKIETLMLGLWALALLGYFASWVGRRPVSAALAWNAYDLFDLLRRLPQIERGTVTVNLQAFHLPLLGLAILLPALLSRAGKAVRWGAVLLGCGLAAMTFPPYPQIINAWRTPGWRVPFWWALGSIGGVIASYGLAPRLGRYRSWWIICIAGIATLPAISTLYRLMPALSTLHNRDVWPGWGAWTCIIGLAVIGLIAWGDKAREVWYEYQQTVA
jgi:hypothetical protein